MVILVTGGAGFIGSNFIHYLLEEYPEDRVVNLDLLTYAGNVENLADLRESWRYRFVRGDVAVPESVDKAFAVAREIWGHPVEAVVHFAAESHVDRSIEEVSVFLRTNVVGTQVLVDVCRRNGVERFVEVSTDEVYGSLGDAGAFTEDSPIAPNSPYAASKAAADLLVRAAWRTHAFPAVITRCSNNYGPYQFPEKLIPLMIANALEGKRLPVYGDGQNVRDWIHVKDHCRGVDLALRRGRPGEVYNFGGRAERANLDVVRTLLQILDRPESLIRFVPDRPGHDRRYAMDSSKAEQELGWRVTWSLEDGLRATVDWYRSHQAWLERVRSGAYREYYARMYDKRHDWLGTVRGEGS